MPASVVHGHRRLLLIGANHLTCSLSDRERLLRRATYARFQKAGGPQPPWDDLLLLTTCNRIEVYTVTRSADEARRVVLEVFAVPRPSQSLYVLEDLDAAEHLLRVASGLDSLALGESQVTVQVRRASAARPARSDPDSFLASLFARSARAATRIRDLAGLNGIDASASRAAIRFIEQTLPVMNPEVVLLGTGKMARMAARALRGRASFTVLDRRPRRAREVASALGGRSEDLRRLAKVLVRADVVLAATASRRPLITSNRLREVVAKRSGRALWLIDLGFPRNIDPRCGLLDGVTLTDVDGLAPWGSRPLPPTALARAESRIRDEAVRLLDAVRPTVSLDVSHFRRAVEQLRREEVENALARLPRLTAEDRTIVDKLATRLVNRFLHGPTERLRNLPDATRTEIVREFVAGLGHSGDRKG